ncbi:Toxin-antitoxin system, toxin component, Txe/YoeB family [Candidatus Desulfarcum epimagneticum]|uniref:Putative mRNA interferase YoeB n=1 Tax=uncultured Desulfobacteraceae bacterium TaxID=218296 RepID=A0A484HCQ2_9BACT|nr:Toxin-antitoxin system, toxin component, Txe/YoeB family [uncultured Desulfobacteraceae bacterium]
MVKWRIVLSRAAAKDGKKLRDAGLQFRAETLLKILKDNPFQTPPSYEKLVGNLKGFYSRRINIKHRLVYSVDQKQRVVHILRMWTHYE